MIKNIIMIKALCVGLLVSMDSQAAFYSISEIGLPGLDGGGMAINDRGDITGRAFNPQTGNYEAFLSQRNQPTTFLGVLGGYQPYAVYSSGVAINNVGQVVGDSSATINGQHTQRAFLASVENGIASLGALSIYASYATGINDYGDAVGTSNIPGSSRAVLYRGGMVTDITPSNAFAANASDINNWGEITGWYVRSNDPVEVHAFLRDTDGAVTDLGTLGGNYSYARGINQKGEVVGHSSIGVDVYGEHAFIVTKNGGMVDIGTLGGPFSFAYDINDRSQVVGYASVPGEYHGFLYSGGALYDVNDLIDPNLGWIISEIYGINNSGQMVGVAISTQDHGAHAVLLDPLSSDLNFAVPDKPHNYIIPEPPSPLFFLAGLAMLSSRFKKRISRQDGT